MHIVVPQTLFLQFMSQQSVLVVHAAPSALHIGVGAAQLPAVQVLVQHSLFFVQAVPLLAHAADWQLPMTQSLLQQSLLFMQLPPMPAHVGCAHVPPVHVPLQQSLEP